MKHKQRHFPDPGYVPKFYGYCRVSHKNQLDRGTSLKDQETRIRGYYQMLAADGKPLEWGGIFGEPLAQSAYSKSFPNRPAGRELKSILNPTDIVCVEKFDRMFRDLEDFIIHRRWFRERAIGFHIVSFMGNTLDANSEMADWILTIFAKLAEMESSVKSERMLLARSSRRAEGKAQGTKPPFFCEFVDKEPGKKYSGRLVVSEKYQKLMEKVVFLFDQEGVNWLQIGNLLWKLEKKNFPSSKVQDMYAFWKRWNKEGRPDVNTFKTREYINGYWVANPREKPKLDNPFKKDTPDG